MTPEEKHQLIGRYLTAYNRFDVEGMLELLTSDVGFENYSNGELSVSTQGLEAFRSLAEQAATMFSEREQRVAGMVQDGDRVLVDIDYRGKLAKRLSPGLDAGSLLELKGQTEFTFSQGKIARIVDRA